MDTIQIKDKQFTVSIKEQLSLIHIYSAVLRWSVLALVAFTMLCCYFLTDVMSPLKPMLEKDVYKRQL